MPTTIISPYGAQSQLVFQQNIESKNETKDGRKPDEAKEKKDGGDKEVVAKATEQPKDGKGSKAHTNPILKLIDMGKRVDKQKRGSFFYTGCSRCEKLFCNGRRPFASAVSASLIYVLFPCQIGHFPNQIRRYSDQNATLSQSKRASSSQTL